MSDFIESTTGVFAEGTFRHLLTREASRATRYQDFFSVCLLKPDIECSPCHLKVCPIDHRCMTRLTPDKAIAALERLWSQGVQSPPSKPQESR